MTAILVQTLTEIRKFDSILNEENRNVVTNNIPISLIRVKLGSKPTDITNRVRAPFASLHSGKPDENWSVPRRIRQNPSIRQILQALLELEVAKRACTTRMHHSLGDTLVVKTMNLSNTN